MRNFKLKYFFSYLITAFRIFIITKEPLKIIYHYLRRTSPKYIKLRNDITIYTSSNPHDIITFVVVFAKKDYGRIKKESIVIDVGANIGIFTLYAILNGASHVEAFEPCSEAYNILKLNIEKNGFKNQVNLNKLAVGDKYNSIVKISKKSSPYNFISEKNLSSESSDLEEVKVTTLDRALEKFKKIDLIKMDCEGAEFIIFPTLTKNFLDKTKEIRMELHGSLDKLISGLNYQPFKIVKKNYCDVWLIK